MSLNPNTATKIQRKLPKTGLQPARCYAIIDIGKQVQVFKGERKEPSQLVLICFEFTKFMHKFKEDQPAQPLTIFQEYTYSLGDRAKLPKVLKSWARLNKPIAQINLKPYLGQYCMLNVEHQQSKDGQNTYAKISGNGLSVSPYMKELGNPPVKFHKDIYFDLDNFSWEVFLTLPKRAQKRIRESQDWSGIIAKFPEPINQGTQGNNTMDADIQHTPDAELNF